MLLARKVVALGAPQQVLTPEALLETLVSLFPVKNDWRSSKQNMVMMADIINHGLFPTDL